MYEENIDKIKKNFNFNKKNSHNEQQDKKIRSPIDKGSVRSKSKKALKNYINKYTVQDFIDLAENEEDDF
jgi:hypothetical protein